MPARLLERQLLLRLDPAVAPDVVHGDASRREHAAHEQPPVTLRRVLFAAQDRDDEPPRTVFQTPDALEERRRRRGLLVDHVPVPIVAGGVIRVSAQLLAKVQILEVGAVEGRLERVSVELGRVARMRARTNVDHHLNAVRLQQRQQRLRVLIRVPDREEPFGQRRVLPADATSPNPLPAAKPMRLYRIGHAPATAAQKSLDHLEVVPGRASVPASRCFAA